MKPLTSHEGLHCANCGTPMQGEFCHACGQSIHSVLKPVHSMLEETLETVLHIDGRIVHTLPPLLFKPGFLTLEYFSGRRVRYIAPFRLMFVLCVLSFFVFHLALDSITAKIEMRDHPSVIASDDAFKHAASPHEVREELRNQLEGLEETRKIGVLPQGTLIQIDRAEQLMRLQANQRLIALGATPMPAASLAAPPAAVTAEGDASDNSPDARNRTSASVSQPVHIAWLPNMVNARLTLLREHISNNWHTFKHGDATARDEAKQRMINGVFGVLPPTMFVLVPVFAILLELFYIFRRRLYMEHLIVALHSHAFLFLSLLLITLIGMLSTWLRPHAAWTGYALGLPQGALMLWIPVYLLVMQKRVYRQSWPMTVLKFWFIGWCYFWLLMIALSVAAALGMAH